MWRVQVDHVSKTFALGQEAESMRQGLGGLILRKTLWQQSRPRSSPALDGIDFLVANGERLGIIGDNGAGKTTLLRVIAGIYKPDRGRVHINGAMTLMTSHGLGMVDDLSIKENVLLYSSIYGMPRSEMADRIPEVIEWAGLPGMESVKLKTVSSGMRRRLAFSVMRYIEKDIYLFDEVAVTGDKTFRRKCRKVFEGYKQSDKTFLVVTHDMSFVNSFCTKALWLHEGKQMAYGPPQQVSDEYQAFTP